MATTYLAMWMQDADTANSTLHLVMLLILLIAAAIVIMAIIVVVIAVKALKTIKELSASAQEVKIKFMPLLAEVTEIGKTSRIVLQDAVPKIKMITENLVKTSDTLVETSKVARGAIQHIDGTMTDANMRVQRQVVRVDGMVTAALTTTSEVMETISNGIRVPAHKIALMITQAKFVGEGLLSKVKSMVDGSPFGSRD